MDNSEKLYFILMSILFTTEELRKLEPHPSEYVEMKTKYLE